MRKSSLLLATLAVSAFLGAAVVAVIPIGSGIDFKMPIDVARK